MKSIKRILCLTVAALLLLSAAGCANTGTDGVSSEEVEEGKFFYHDENGQIVATLENTRLLGRGGTSVFRKYDSETEITTRYYDVPQFNWPASGFEVTFVGTGLEVQLASANGNKKDESSHAFLYVIIDGQDDPDKCEILELKEIAGWYTVAKDLTPGTHTAKLIRTNSNDADGASQTGVIAYKVLGENGYMTNPPKLKNIRVEAFGDSITCGDELFRHSDGSTTSDGWRTYAAYVARQLDAELNVVAISGNGLICSLFGTELFEIPDQFDYVDKFHFSNDKWDFSQYQANIVLINLGTNDCAGVPNNFTYEQFEDAYVDFCTRIKTAYPDCVIVALLGMMDGRGKVWPSIENAAARINKQYGSGTMYTLWLEVAGISDSPVQGGAHPSIAAQEKAGEMILDLLEANTEFRRKQ